MNYTHVHNYSDFAQSFTKSDGTRIYRTLTGSVYPSVTTVMSHHTKPGIMAWKESVGPEEANKISRQATIRGSRVHNLVEQTLKNKDYQPYSLTLPLPVLMMFDSLLPYLQKINNIHAIETALYSDFLRLAGRVDCIAEYENELSIIDIKTASKAKKKEYISHYFMQCSAYAIMYEELTHIPVPNIIVIMAVEDNYPIIFKERRNTWAKQLLSVRDQFETDNHLTYAQV